MTKQNHLFQVINGRDNSSVIYTTEFDIAYSVWESENTAEINVGYEPPFKLLLVDSKGNKFAIEPTSL